MECFYVQIRGVHSIQFRSTFSSENQNQNQNQNSDPNGAARDGAAEAEILVGQLLPHGG